MLGRGGRFERACGLKERAEDGADIGVLSDVLSDDIARSGEDSFGIGELALGRDKGLRLVLRISVHGLREDALCERLKAALLRDISARLSLLFIRRVEIFEAGLLIACADSLLEPWRELALLLDRFED